MDNQYNKKTICNNIKRIKDNIHGLIPLSIFALEIIDTYYFQRLRKIKQLGACIYVYHNATHTRFEHSIGTYYLAGELLNNIIINNEKEQLMMYMKEIKLLEEHYKTTGSTEPLDKYVIELCKIAALCHDIGHGPFSHLFDDIFIKKVGKDNFKNSTHEERSEVLLELIIKKSDILKNLITDDEIQFMKNLINPKKEHIGFIYQIVSNNYNGLDVDKYDYITRDNKTLFNNCSVDINMLIKDVKIIDNNIVYSEQTFNEIKKLYLLRHEMHSNVYSHKSVVSSELLIVELLLSLNPFLKIADCLDDMEEFCKFTDEYILESIKFLQYMDLKDGLLEHYNKAFIICDRLNNHKLYPFIMSKITKNEINIKKFIKQHQHKIFVCQFKIGYVSGKKTNPLDNINVYKTKSLKVAEANKINKFSKTLLIPNLFQEYVTMFFLKNDYDIVNHKNLKNDYEYYENLVKLECDKH
jgi:HD superfamily phosphohydrolase